MVFKVFAPLDGAENAPRSTQDAPKPVLKSYFFDVQNCDRFWCDLGSILGAFWEPFWLPKRVPKSTQFMTPSNGVPKKTQEAPKRPQESSQEAPRSPKRASRGAKSSPKRPQRVPREPSRGTKSPHPQDPVTTKPPNQQAVKQSNQGQGGRRHRASALKIYIVEAPH